MAKPVKQSVPINFSGGLDTKNDPFQVGPANFLALNNMVFSTGGRLTKRNGFASLGTAIVTPNPALTYSNVGANLTSARKIMAYGDELLVNDAFNLYSYDSANNSWVYKGRSTVVGLETENVVSGASTWTQSDVSIDTTTGIKVFAYGNGTQVRYSIQDISTGQFLVNQALFAANTPYVNPRCVSIAGKSWITAVRVQDNKIYYQAIVGQTVTGSVTALVTDLATTYTFTVSSANATSGATYTNSGNTFTVTATIAGALTLVTRGNAPPAASGTLTKASGTGDATIAFSTYAASAQNYDIDVDSFSGNIYLAYYSNTPGVTIAALSNSFVIGNTITKSESATNGVSFFGDGSNIWVVYNNGSATKGFIVNNAVSATVLAPTVIDSGATAANVNNVTGTYSTTLTTGFVFYDPYVNTIGLTDSASINYNTMTVAGSVGTPNVLMGTLSLNSKAFSVSGIPHVVGLYTYPTLGGTVVQATNFLVNLYNVTPSMGSSANNDVVGNIAAKISPDEASTSAPSRGFIHGVHQSASGVWELSLLQNTNYAFTSVSTGRVANFNTPTGVIDCQFDFNLSNPDAKDLGNNLNVAGGQLSMYDGAGMAEQNFHLYPNAGITTPADSGGSMGSGSANTLYGYIYVYEWIDNHGQVHRSFPSPVMNPLKASQVYTFASGTTAGQVTLSIPCLRVTNKSGTQVVINVYRTVGNGSVYFLTGTGAYGTITNDPSADTVSFVDRASDATILGNIQLYTTGALGYFAPPATAALATFKNRLLAVPYEGNQDDFLYSNQVLTNFPVQFVPEFDLNVGTIGGPLIALAGMDDKIILFKSGTIPGPSILYMVGQGPAQSGAGNDFTDPLPVAVDAGCVDRASIVLTPVGLMFKSNKGIYLLDRNLTASYIGSPVESYNQYSVVSSQLIPNTTQVRFLLSNGTLLMYDYFYKVWATFTNPAGISDCIFQGQHTYVSSTGVVYKETPGVYVDGTATPILMSFTTSWIKLAGLQGYQRAFFFYLLAGYISGHQISLSLYTDFSATPDQATVITPDATNTLENWRVFFAKQRCQSFQIALTEVYTGTLGASFSLSGLNLIVGAKSAFLTLPSAQSAG